MNSKTDEIWYWEKGLHDARIISALKDELDFNIKDPNPKRNKLVFEIDCSQSMFEKTVKRIIFYNFKIDCDLLLLQNVYWVTDEVVFNKGKYTLLLKYRLQKEIRKCQIQFDYIDVLR